MCALIKLMVPTLEQFPPLFSIGILTHAEITSTQVTIQGNTVVSIKAQALLFPQLATVTHWKVKTSNLPHSMIVYRTCGEDRLLSSDVHLLQPSLMDMKSVLYILYSFPSLHTKLKTSRLDDVKHNKKRTSVLHVGLQPLSHCWRNVCNEVTTSSTGRRARQPTQTQSNLVSRAPSYLYLG